MDMIKRTMIKHIKGKKPYLVVGFPGTGLVGSVALAQYCDETKSEFIGYIESPFLAPLASIHNYEPLPAVRIHYIKEHNVVLFFSEMTIPVKLSLAFSQEILKLASELGSEHIISIGGIVMSKPKPIYYVATNEKLTKKLKKIGTPIKEGATTGITALLLTKGRLSGKSVVSILAHVSNDYIDPTAAANGLNALGKIINKKINTSELLKEASIIKNQTKKKIVTSKILDRKMADTNMYG